MTTIQLRNGDCIEVMRGLTEGSVGAVVSDPPYGLRFMGKAFDNLGDGAAQREWHRGWVEPAYRVLVPGGVIKAFGGTRTFHHLAAVMRVAGFTDIRLEAWSYGSGFPKSLDVSKAIDKAAGAEREVLGLKATYRKPQTTPGGWECLKREPYETAPATGAARQWSGWGTALKPAWEPVLVGTKP